MKRFLIFYISVCILNANAQQINPPIFGQNAWYIDVNDPNNASTAINWATVEASGVKTVRIGGIGPNWTPINATKLVTLINNIQSTGVMTAIVQVGYNPDRETLPIIDPNRATLTEQAQEAKDLVDFVNLNLTTADIEYWIVSNEPDGDLQTPSNPWGFGWDTDAEAVKIHDYIQKYWELMTNSGADVNIKLIGPELTFYRNYVGSQLINELTSGANSILPFIKVFSFHYYPFNNEGVGTDGLPYPDRNNVIKYLSTPVPRQNTGASTPLADIITELQGKITLSGFPVEIAITEANICHKNDINTTDAFNYTDDSYGGNGANSFIAGQFWAEMMAISMQNNVKFLNFWSVKEGNSNTNYVTNAGYLNNDPNIYGGVGGKKSTYHHFQMVATNFKGNFLANQFLNNNYQYKAFAYKNGSEIGVMIMNQSLAGAKFSINLNGAVTGAADIKVELASLVTGNYSCNIGKESTILLKFTNGAFLSRTEYNLGHTMANLPPKVTSINADAFIEDYAGDSGAEPCSCDPWHVTESTGIWVRNYGGYGAVDASGNYSGGTHQNPDYTAVNAKVPHFYVRLQNPGCNNPVAGNIHIYYTKPATSDIWGGTSTDWTEINSGGYPIVIPADRTDYVTDIPWLNMSPTIDPGTGQANHCFLVRFVSTADPMSNELTMVQGSTNAKNNNNITQKNMILVNTSYNNKIIVRNIHNLQIATTLVFTQPETETGNPFTNDGYVSIDLGKEIYERWVKGGKRGSGFIIEKEKWNHMSPTGIIHNHSHLINNEPSPYTIKAIGAVTRLENILLEPKQEVEVSIRFNFKTTNGSKSEYNYSIRQFEMINDKEEFTGQVKFIITPPLCTTPNAGNDVTIGRQCTTNLSATPLIEGAEYNWYNNKTGLYIGSGSTLTVSPHVTTTYELEIISPSGCIDYDVVTVNVLSNTACQSGCGPVDYFNVTLNSSTQIEEKTIVIDGILKVPNNVILNVTKSKLLFTENSGIEVMTGGKLILSNTELRPCDITKKWKGISIKGNNSDITQLTITESHFYDAINPLIMEKVNGANILGNTFDNGTTAITMDKCKNFTIAKNQFYIYDKGVYATNSILDIKSMINENYFYKVSVSVQLENGNHTKLDIKCNVFEAYTDYAILSSNSTLKNQGTTSEGAGNLFFSNSTKLNDKLNHNGNSMSYYYDPSNPVSLVTGTSLKALAQPAAIDGSCNQTQNARMSEQSIVEENALLPIETDFNFQAFPNPFKDQLTILFTLPLDSKGGTIKIYEIASGKEVYTSSIVTGQNKLVIDQLNIAEGIYICNIIAYNGSSKQFKLINIK